MTAQLVYNNIVDGDNISGTLFHGKKIWFSQTVPSRQRFIQEVEANGGIVTLLEKDADIRMVDHARKRALPETYSYRYIELSVRNGQLENLEDHRAGPPSGTIRSTGSVIQPAKSGRNAFTIADDNELREWVVAHEEKGCYTSGNEIYKKLERKNPRHTYQSWRDRWVRHLKDRPRPSQIPQNAPLTPPSDRNTEGEAPKAPEPSSQVPSITFDEFTDEDAKALLASGGDIERVLPERIQDAWNAWAAKYPIHSAHKWRVFWETRVRPIYQKETPEKIMALIDKSRKPAEEIEVSTMNNTAKVMTVTAALTPRKKTSPPRIFDTSRSPSLQPSTPTRYSSNPMDEKRIDPKLLTIPDQLEASTSTSDNHFRPPFSANLIDRTPLKRKRVIQDVEDAEEPPHSSPMKPVTPIKRPRLFPGSSQEPIEIASTPSEDRPSHGSPATTVIDNNVVKPEQQRENSASVFGLSASPSLSESYLSAHSSASSSGRGAEGSDLDFELAPPPGGWDQDHEKDNAVPPETEETQPRALDTQAILTGDTQEQDLLLPDPEGGWNALIPSSPPTRVPVSLQPDETSANEAETESEDEDPAEVIARVDAWIDQRISGGLDSVGVATALKCASMDVDLADEVLKHVVRYGEIPRDQKGVWTEEDDDDLSAMDGRKIMKVLEKHGREAFDARWDFLRFYRGSE